MSSHRGCRWFPPGEGTQHRAPGPGSSASLRRAPGELLIIALLAVSRYLPAGWISSLALPGRTLRQGTEAWVATTAVSPTLPEFDLVLRVAMYAGWGFGLERATSEMFLSGGSR